MGHNILPFIRIEPSLSKFETPITVAGDTLPFTSADAPTTKIVDMAITYRAKARLLLEVPIFWEEERIEQARQYLSRQLKRSVGRERDE